MEIKIVEQDILKNMEKSFNLNDLKNLLNISFEKFNRGKEFITKKDIQKSNQDFNYSLYILKELNTICSKENCDKDIKSKIKKAIETIAVYISNNKDKIEENSDSTSIKKNITQLGSSNNKGDKISEEEKIPLKEISEEITETILPGYKDFSKVVFEKSPELIEKTKNIIEKTVEKTPEFIEKTVEKTQNIIEKTVEKNKYNDESTYNKELYSLINCKYMYY